MLKESETIEFKKSTAEVSAKGGSLPVRQAGASGGKAGVVSIAAMLNKYSRVVEAGRLEFKEGKNRKI
ncbi:MAG: hypothetical protein HZC18_05265 [Candidatus Omnitrophica bacterium]|nr:hypothetical protein [Candidatus Omnitrophota bacterium]